MITILVIGNLVGCSKFVTVATEEYAAPSQEGDIKEQEPIIQEKSTEDQEKAEAQEGNENQDITEPKDTPSEPDQGKEIDQPTKKPSEEETDPVETDELSNEKKGWSWKRNQEHTPPTAYTDLDLTQYDAYYLGDTTQKIIYLTFDEGYENGFTSTILDVLKENEVKAAFFVTQPYVRDNPELAKRMKEEGHVVGNHSVSHKSFPSLSDEDIKFELEETSQYFQETTGYDMDPFFRPPSGEYSERILALAKNLGWASIFWSVAYQDWDTGNQPGAEYAYHHVMENYHPGAIILLHAVSESNTQALDQILKGLKEEGYEFASLYELP